MAQQIQAISSNKMNISLRSNHSSSSSLDNDTAAAQSTEVPVALAATNGDIRLEVTDNMMSMMSLTDITLEDAVTKIKEIESANLLLRDYLKKNNDEVRRQYESLRTLKMKEREKFEQTKAVITALRQENEELQVKLLNDDETVSELQKSLKHVKNDNARLQQQRKMQNPSEDSETGSFPDTVYVAVENQDAVIADLNKAIISKEECISLLQADLTKHKKDVDKYHDSARQLMEDLESQQILKAATDDQNRRLNQQLDELSKKLHEQMHNQLSSTKRELEGIKSLNSPFTDTAASFNNSRSLLQEDSLEDLIDRAKSIEEAKQDNVDKLKATIEKETSEKRELEKRIQELAEKIKELTLQNSEALQKISSIEREKYEEISTICQEYEAKLTEKTKQDVDQQRQEPTNTDDVSVMRSQILSLFNEVNEAQHKLSDATTTIHYKDEKIAMLYQSLASWEKQHLAMSNENMMFRRHLDAQNNAQKQAQHNISIVQQEKRQLQDSLDKLINDYGVVVNLLDSFKADPYKTQMTPQEVRRRSNESMEELNRLTAEVFAAEEALALKDDQMKEIRDKLDIAEEDREILKIQVDTYRLDFENERDSRTKQAQEKEEILDALKICQGENQMFKEKIWEENKRQMAQLQRQVYPQDNHPNIKDRSAAEGGARMSEIGGNSPRPSTFWGSPHSNQTKVPQLPPRSSQQPASYASPVSHNYFATAMPPQPFDPRQDFSYQFQDREPIKMSEEEIGDGGLASLMQYECPSCNAQFPDQDSLHLHVPDCIDSRQSLN